MTLKLDPRLAQRGYTLLEVVLAMAISLLLLGALYVAMNVQLQNEQAGRDVVEQSALGRSILNRMALDITASLGPLNPNLVSPTAPNTSAGANTNSNSSTGSGASSTAGATTGATGATGSGQAAGGGASGGTGGGGGGGGSAKGGPISTLTFNLGLQGDANSLTIYTSKGIRTFDNNGFTTDPNAPTPLTGANAGAAAGSSGDGQQLALTDVRRITYQIGDGGGLQRQESIVVATYDLSLNQFVADDPSGSVQFQTLAEEVDSLQFRYWDPQAGWVNNWPSDATGYDGMTPMGPPMAVEITIHVVDSHARGAAAESGRTYVQVVEVLTADATPMPQQGSTGTSQSTTGN